MQIVIEIPEEKVERLIKQMKLDRNFKACKIVELPKGHGRLIDADALYNELEFPSKRFGEAFKEILDDAPTIIEADKESEEA